MKKKRIDDWHSTPASNIIHLDSNYYCLWRQGMYALEWKLGGGNLVKKLQGLWRKQDYTFTGEFHHYVWESDDQTWRVFVSSGKGIQFEVNPLLDVSGVTRAWKDFVGKFGFTDEYLVSEYQLALKKRFTSAIENAL